MAYFDSVVVNGKKYTSTGTLYAKKSEAERMAKIMRGRMYAIVREMVYNGKVRYLVLARHR